MKRITKFLVFTFICMFSTPVLRAADIALLKDLNPETMFGYITNAFEELTYDNSIIRIKLPGDFVYEIDFGFSGSGLILGGAFPKVVGTITNPKYKQSFEAGKATVAAIELITGQEEKDIKKKIRVKKQNSSLSLRVYHFVFFGLCIKAAQR